MNVVNPEIVALALERTCEELKSVKAENERYKAFNIDLRCAMAMMRASKLKIVSELCDAKLVIEMLHKRAQQTARFGEQNEIQTD
jgi:hypothetical protein